VERSPLSPKLLKGALVEMSERFLGPIPNVILFQYNPSGLTRTLRAHAPGDRGGEEGDAAAQRAVGTVQPFDPEESVELSLLLDATDALEKPDSHPVAVLAGVADRLSALELLLYPQDRALADELLGAVGAVRGGLGGPSPPPERRHVPIVLFAWGPGRIVPVRVTSFRVEEQAFSPTLYPIRATVRLGLRIVQPSELEAYPDGFAKELAKTAYGFTRTQKKTLAAANLANAVESILGMLPS
jgi:hypothetical protein